MRRTFVGTAYFAVTDLKLGQGTSTVQVTVSQNGRDEITGIFTNSDMAKPLGPSLATGWEPLPKPNLALPTGSDLAAMLAASPDVLNATGTYPLDRLVIANPPGGRDPRQATLRAAVLMPKRETATHAGLEIDQWIGFESGEKVDNIALGFVADTFPQMLNAIMNRGQSEPSGTGIKQEPTKRYWFPTVVLNLDIRKPLPDAGLDAVHCRVVIRKVENGRFDIEMLIFDPDGDLVATSTHVCMIVDMSRNTAGRSSKL